MVAGRGCVAGGVVFLLVWRFEVEACGLMVGEM